MQKSTIKFFFDQHGCAKNQVDSEQMIAVLLQDSGRFPEYSFEQVFDIKKADIIIINTCGFIESAKKESLDALISARKSCPSAKIIFAGCLAERYAKIFATELPEADAIFGLGDKTKLAEYALALFTENKTLGDIVKTKKNYVTDNDFDITIDRTKLLYGKSSVYVKITEGCSNHCTFCAIPLIRGEGRSRPVASIVNEIKDFLAQGVFEINLVGQDIASHNGILELLEKVSEISGNFWLRLLYIHPDHFPFSVLPIIARDKRILPYFDIPFQSGSDTVIRLMGRHGTQKIYTELIEKIRGTLNGAVFRTTFLAGFPGETEEDAAQSEFFLRTIQSDWSGVFCYSKEDGTPAALFKNQVKKSVAKKRAENLVQIQGKIIEKKLQQYIGRIFEILIEEVFEKTGDDENCYALGRAWFQAPEIDGSIVLVFDENARGAKKIKEGAVIAAKITASRPPCLEAKLPEEV